MNVSEITIEETVVPAIIFAVIYTPGLKVRLGNGICLIAGVIQNMAAHGG